MYGLRCIPLFKILTPFNLWFGLRTKSKFLFRKGVIEVISYLDKIGKAGYYEIYKQDFVVSRQTFANLLKELENEGLVNRRVIEERPPRVEYSLTGKGKKVADILSDLEREITF